MVRNLEFERKVGPKGQIVIPQVIRKNMGIEPESKVFVTTEDEKIVIVIKPKRLTAEEFFNIVPKEKRRHISMREIKKLEEEEYEEEWREIKRGLSRR